MDQDLRSQIMYRCAFKTLLGRLLFGSLYLCLFYGVLTPSAACQQPGAAGAAGASPGSYTLSGTVVNSLTGEPLHRAAVEMLGQITRMTLTDSSGHFEFDGVVEQRAYLTASKPGFLTGQGPFSGSNAVSVNRDSSPILLKMSPTNTVIGRVTGGDKQPLEGFVVQAIGRQVIDGRLTVAPSGSQAQTDENGDFRIYGLPDDTYYLIVNQQNQQTTLSQAGIPNAREQTYSTVYFPGVADSSAATPIALASGQSFEANFTLTAELLYQVSGAVNAESIAIPQFSMTRNTREESDYMQYVSIQSGRFKAKLPAGSYTVNANQADGNALTASVTIDSDNADLHLVFVPAPAIEVHLRTEHSAGSAPQQVSHTDYVQMGLNIQLFSTSSSHPRTAWWDPRSNTIRNIQQGVFRLGITAPPPWWVKSASCGGTDLLTDDLRIPAAGSIPPIEVTLQDGAGVVRGTVTVSDGPEYVTAILLQPHSDQKLIQQAGPDGNFIFPAVGPGDYSLLAFRTVDQIEYGNPAVLEGYLSGAAHISVQANTTTSVSVGLSPARR